MRRKTFEARKQVDAELIEGEIVIRLPLEKPRWSKTGKTKIMASSKGNAKTSVIIGGCHVYVGANAFVFPNGRTKQRPLQKGSKAAPVGGSKVILASRESRS